MIRIEKTNEPKSDTIWKALACPEWEPTWGNLQNPQKSELLAQLIKDQKGICCYCECKITPENSHIEHITPRSIGLDIKLSYENLLASCLKETAKGVPLTCGKERGNWNNVNSYLNPCDAQSSQRLKYSMDGKVSGEPCLHDEFILELKLNSSKKVSSRKAAAAIFSIDDSSDDAKKILSGLLKGNRSAEYISYLLATAEAYFGIDGATLDTS
jgi:uncharacterized protein (TIGR02646 family)